MDYKLTQNLRTLEQERFTLLAQLEGYLDVPSPSDTNDFRQSLLLEYNEVTRVYNDALEAARTHSPDQLPTELWIKIIKEVVFDPENWAFKTLLSLTLVSQKWAAVIVETPSLWTSMSFPGNADDFDALMAIHLYLSSPLPLSLRLGYNPGYIEQAAPLLLPHAHRIEELEIFSSDFALSHPFLTQTTFTSLRSIRVYGSNLVTMSRFFVQQLGFKLPFIIDRPRLSYNSGHWAAADGKLTDLWLPLLDTSTLHLLDLLTSLEQFQADGNDKWHTDDSDLILVEPPTSRLGFHHLHLRHVPWRLLQNIIGRCDTHLTWLSISLSWNNLCPFFDMLDRLLGLRHLQLVTLRNHHDIVQVKEPEETTVHSSLRSFDLVFASSLYEIIDITSYLTTLIQKAPGVEAVRICGSGLEIASLTVLARLNFLTSLEIKRVKSIEAIGDGVINMPSRLRELTISGDDVLPKMLRSTTTSSLCVDLDEILAVESPLLVEGDNWGAVTTLTIDCYPSKFGTKLGHVQLGKLRSIEITSWSFAASLCRNLAMLPNDLLALEEFHSNTVVEWDIFLIMLERRLVAKSKGISSLRKISFSTGIPRFIRSIIIKNLRGYIVERPHNYNLSLLANCKAILDPSIPGCIRCHLQHIYCSQPVINPDGELLNSLLGIYASSPKYPETEAGILETWEIRFKRLWPIIFKSDKYSRTIRANSCNTYHSVELTRDSILEEFENEVPFAYLYQAGE